jgi:hypothetical protein
MVVDNRWDMKRERHPLGAAVSRGREDHKRPNLFHSCRGLLFVVGVLMAVWVISVHMI